VLRVRESKSAAGVVKYHDEALARDDYYRDKDKVTSQWIGEGAKRFGLEGEVKRKDFVALVNNRDPNTGERLTVRDKKNRRPGYEATLTSWKSASVMNNVCGCDDVQEAFWRAGDETMVECAEPEVQTRVRADGADYDRLTGNVPIAAFRHSDTRPEDGWSDPHDHTHYYMPNVTWDKVENRNKAAQLGQMKAKAPRLELEFDHRYARELMALGYVPTMGKHGPQIKGVPQSVIDKFSRNSIRNENEALSRGLTDDKEKRKLSDRLRKSKKGDLSPAALLEQRLSQLTDAEKAALEKVRNREIKPGPEITPRQARDYAIDHLFQRRDDISENKLRKTMVHYGIGHVSPKQADAEIAGAIKDGSIIALEGEKGRIFVKHSTVRDQGYITRNSRGGIGKYEPLTYGYKDQPELSRDQNGVTRSIAESRDKYMGFRGPAGTGKSYTLKGLDSVLQQRKARGEKHFSRALALAPSASASRGELRKAGFRDADTLASFFSNEKKQEEMRGQLLIVDESGMMSTRDMVQLMNIAEKHDNRVLFVGDWKQHASVDAGDAFRLLQAEGGLKYAELTENRRQEDKAHREAVNKIATGMREEIGKGFKELDKLGAVVVEKDRDKLRQKLTRAFLKAKDQGETALIITPTHKEAEYLTAHLREALKEQGQIRGKEQDVPVRKATVWTEAQKRDERNYDPGMIIEFHKAVPGVQKRINGRKQTVGGFARGERALVMEDGMLMRGDGSTAPLPASFAGNFEVYRTGTQKLAAGDQIRITKNARVKVEGQAIGTRVDNGDVYPVEGFTKEGDIRLPNGKILPRNFGHIAYGYTSTSQRSQGNTVDREFVDWNTETLKALDMKGGYVTSSRFRKGITYFVDNKDAVSAAIQRGGDRKTALELLKEHRGEEKITIRPRFTALRHIESNRMLGFFKKRVDSIRDYARNVVDKWQRRGELQHA
jgi:conjugative relaxase-like TrwC/TraI family protein